MEYRSISQVVPLFRCCVIPLSTSNTTATTCPFQQFHPPPPEENVPSPIEPDSNLTPRCCCCCCSRSALPPPPLSSHSSTGCWIGERERGRADAAVGLPPSRSIGGFEIKTPRQLPLAPASSAVPLYGCGGADDDMHQFSTLFQESIGAAAVETQITAAFGRSVGQPPSLGPSFDQESGAPSFLLVGESTPIQGQQRHLPHRKFRECLPRTKLTRQQLQF